VSFIPNKPNPDRSETKLPTPNIYDLGVKTGTAFKMSPKLMAEFNSYEEYKTIMTRILKEMKKMDEVLQAAKVEPLDPWTKIEKRRGGEKR